MPEVRSTFQLRLGDRMPEFSLCDAWGDAHASEHLVDENGVLVVFACNHCPYVVHLADLLGEMAREFSEKKVSTVAINPNDSNAYPQDGPEHMRAFASAHRWCFPYLIDQSQEVALAYGAACTPDFFLFDGRKELTYAGQFDGTRPKSGRSPDGSDLREAMQRMLDGKETGVTAPSSGCSIKWRPGKQPDWWNAG